MCLTLSIPTYQRGAHSRPYSYRTYMGYSLASEAVARRVAERMQRSNPAVRVRTVRVADTGAYVNVIRFGRGEVAR